MANDSSFKIKLDYKQPVKEAIKYMESALTRADLSANINTDEFDSLKKEVAELKKSIIAISETSVSTDVFEKYKKSAKNSIDYIRRQFNDLSDQIDATVNVKLKNALGLIEQGISASSKQANKSQNEQSVNIKSEIPTENVSSEIVEYKQLESELNVLQSRYDNLRTAIEVYQDQIKKYSSSKLITELKDQSNCYDELYQKVLRFQEQQKEESTDSPQYVQITSELKDLDPQLEETAAKVQILSNKLVDMGSSNKGINSFVNSDEFYDLTSVIDADFDDFDEILKKYENKISEFKNKLATLKNAIHEKTASNVNEFKSNTSDTVEVNVTPIVDQNFNSKLQEQANKTDPINISVSPIIDQNFKSKLQEQVDQANISIEVDVVPKISENYTEKLKEATNKITVDHQENSEANISNELDINNEINQFSNLKSSIDAVRTSIQDKNEELRNEISIATQNIPDESRIFNDLKQSIQDVQSAIEKKTAAILAETEQSVQALNEEKAAFTDIGDAATKSIKKIKFPSAKSLNDLLKALDNLKKKLDQLNDPNGENSFINQLAGLKVTKIQVKNLSDLGDVLKELKEKIDALNADNNPSSFLNDISSIVRHTKELEHIVQILNKSGKSGVKIEDPELTSAYKQLKDNLTIILNLKKKLGQTDDSAAQAAIRAKIDSYDSQNRQLREQIKLSKSVNEEKHNEIVNLGKQIGLQNQLNSARESENRRKNYQSSQTNEFQTNYKQLYDNLSEIKSLEKQFGRTTDQNERATISSSIQQYENQNKVLKQNISTLLSRNSALKSSTSIEQNKITILEQEIATTRQLNQIADTNRQQAQADQAKDLQNNLNEVNQILQEDSQEWKRAMDILTDNSYFKEARNGAQSYLDILENVVSITRSLRTDDATGKKYVSYQYKDTNGSSITTGANGNLEIEKKNIYSLTNAYKVLTSAVELYDKESKKPTGNTTKYKNIIAELKQLANEYKSTVGKDGFKISSKADVDLVITLAAKAKELVTDFKGLSAAEKKVTDTSIDKFLNKIYTFMGQNTKAAKAFQTELEALIGKTKTLGSDANINGDGGLMDQFMKIKNEAERAGLTNDSFLDSFAKQANYTASSFLAQYLSVQDVIRYAQNAIQTINDLDYALLDLSKTAKMSEAQLNEFYYSANESAIKLGTSTENIINLASSWSRLGYGTNEEATKLAELTAKFAAVSPGMSTEEASKGMISIMKAWQDRINAENMETEVLDKINVLGNKFALDNNDVIEGMQKCSAALSAMGTSYTDAFALFTGAEEVMQDADKVGNGLKSVAMRIRGYSEDVESGEYVIDDSLKNISGDLIDLTKIAGKLPQGISVYTEDTKDLPEAEKKYKSLVEYFREIHKYWDDFSETQQTELLQKLFAKTQASVGASLIKNWDAVEKSLVEMENSAGSADAEMSKAEQTISYKLNALKETWVGFLQEMANRNAIKGIIDGLTTISQGFTSLGGIGVAGVLAGITAALIKLNTTTTESGKKVVSFGKIIRSFLGTDVLRTKYLDDYAKTLSTSNVSTIQSIINTVNLNKAEKEELITKAGLNVATEAQLTTTEQQTAAQALQKITQVDQTVTEQTLTAAKLEEAFANGTVTQSEADLIKKRYLSIDATKNEHTSLLSLIKAHPVLTVAIVGTTIAAAAFINELKKESTHIEDIRSKVEDLTSSYQTNLSTVKENASDAKDLYAEYSKLAKGVDSLGNNKSLSDSNFDRYNELTDQLAEKMPGLVTGWTNQNHAILKCKDSVEALNAEIDKQNLDAYRKILIGDDGNGAKDIVENYQNVVNGYDGKFLGHIKGASEKENDLDFVLKKTQELQTALDQLKESGNNIEDFVKYASSPHLFADNTFSPILDKINTLKYLMKNSGLNTDGLKINFDTIQSWNDLDAAIYDVQSDINSEKTDLSTQVDEAVSGVQQLADAYLHLYNKDGKTFYDLSDDMAASVSYMIQSLDEDVLNQFGVNTKADVQKIVNTMVETMLNDPTLGNAIVQLFTLDQSQSVEAARATAEPYLDALNKAFKKGDIPQTLYDLIVGNLDWIDDVESKLNGAIAGALSGDIDTEQAKLNSIKQEATENEKTGFKDAQLHNETLANDQKKINDLTQEQLEIEKQINVAKAERQAKYSSSDMMGNVDLNNRPVVSGINMSAAGLEGDADSYSTVYTYTKPFDNPIDGNPWIVQFTPILPDGTVMTEDSCYEYIHDLINKASSKEDMMSMDNPENGGKGIFMGVFDSYTDETGKTKSLNWNNVDQGYKQYNQEAIARHDNQASIYDNEGELVQQQVKNQKALSEAQEKYQNDLKQSGNASDYYSQKIEEQQKKTSNLSQAEKTLTNYMNKLDTAQAQQDFATYLNSLGKTISTAAEAKAAIRGFKVEAQNSGNSFDISGLSTAIESLEKVNTAYQKVAENIKDNKTGKDITSSIKDIEALRKEFEDISNTDLNWGDFDGFEDIERTLTDGSSSAKEMQSAFDQLYTTLAQDKLAANDFDESTQSLVSSQLQAAGASKESADAWVAQQVAIHNAKKAVSDYGINLQTVTQGDINELTTEGSVSQDTAQYLSLLALQTQLASNTVFDTEASREQLYALAEAAGIARDEIASVYSQSSISKMAGSGADQSTINKIKKQQSKTVDDIRKEVENKLQDKINNIHLAPTTTSTPKSSGGGGGSSKSEEKDEYVEEFEKQYKELGELRDNDKIDEYEYCQYLRALYEKFFKDKAKYIEQYQKYESEYLSKMKSVYENIFSGLSSKIDDRISKLDKQKSKETSAVKEQKTAAVSALKAQKQAAVNAIEAQIKALKEQQKQLEKQIDIYQGQIDAINDANDAREREIALQKALYDLDKLQNQRTNLTYSESQGMHYESDLSGIRDARESVQDAKDDIEIANIQKKIDLLNKEKDLLDDQIDALNDKKDAIEDYYDTLIDETEAYYDNLITQIEAAYEKQTENLNNAKEKLDKIKEYFSDAQLAAQISEMTGQSVNSILDAFQSGDEKFLDSLQLQYAEVIKDMMSDNQTFLDSFSQVSNIDMSGVTGFLEKTQNAFKGIENTNFDVVKDGIKSVEEAFGSLDDKIAVSNLFGANSDFEKTATEAAEKAGTTFTSSLSNFFESDESAFGAGKEAAKKVAEGMTSDGAKTEVESKGKEVATTAANSVKTAATSDPDVQAANEEAGKAVTSGVGKGMVSDDAKAETDAKGKEVATAAANSVKTAAISDADVQAASKEAGKSLTTNIMSGATEGLSDSDFQDKLQAFVDGIAQKIQEAFSKLDTSNLLDFSSIFSTVDDASEEGQSTSNIFSQMLQDVQNFATEFANIDISPVVQQFSDLRDAVVETSQAITGEGGTSSGSDQTTGTSIGGKSKKGGKQSSSSQSNSGSGGSLADAMQAFGDTSNEVLGGSGEEGGDDEGSGVIGQFTTLKTKVEEVAATLGSGDETGGGGKSGGKSGGKGAGAEESGTLISALQAVGETAMDEEIGLPKQIEEWGKVSDGIGQCIDALNDFKNGLNELKSFTITVEFASEFAEAAGTMSNESGAAHFQGTAFARGNAGLQSDQRALVGEQGPEMKISGNRWSLVGKNGAEYADLKAGDIIFSAAQTKELMKHGKLHSRGRTVGGNAYADGTPLGNAIRFAGSDHSSTQLAALAAKLTGTIGIMTSGIDSIERAASELTKNVSNVTNNSANQETNVSIGDIYLQGVNDTDSLAKAIKSYLPGAMLQQLHKT